MTTERSYSTAVRYFYCLLLFLLAPKAKNCSTPVGSIQISVRLDRARNEATNLLQFSKGTETRDGKHFTILCASLKLYCTFVPSCRILLFYTKWTVYVERLDYLYCQNQNLISGRNTKAAKH